jgi:hypothetical protein
MVSEELNSEARELDLPADLVAEVSRHAAHQSDFHVDGWSPSLLERIKSLLGLP